MNHLDRRRSVRRARHYHRMSSVRHARHYYRMSVLTHRRVSPVHVEVRTYGSPAVLVGIHRTSRHIVITQVGLHGCQLQTGKMPRGERRRCIVVVTIAHRIMMIGHGMVWIVHGSMKIAHRSMRVAHGSTNIAHRSMVTTSTAVTIAIGTIGNMTHGMTPRACRSCHRQLRRSIIAHRGSYPIVVMPSRYGATN